MENGLAHRKMTISSDTASQKSSGTMGKEGFKKSGGAPVTCRCLLQGEMREGVCGMEKI
jgi:hypothetical protein